MSKWQKVVWLVFTFPIVLGSLITFKLTSQNNHLSRNTSNIMNQQTWENNTIRLLNEESTGDGGYNDLLPNQFSVPDLYGTYYAVSILNGLNYSFPSAKRMKIIHWAQGKIDPNGGIASNYSMYIDSAYYAVGILTKLDARTPYRKAIEQKLLSLQNPQGYFIDKQLKNQNTESKFLSTYMAIETLKELGFVRDIPPNSLQWIKENHTSKSPAGIIFYGNQIIGTNLYSHYYFYRQQFMPNLLYMVYTQKSLSKLQKKQTIEFISGHQSIIWGWPILLSQKTTDIQGTYDAIMIYKKLGITQPPQYKEIITGVMKLFSNIGGFTEPDSLNPDLASTMMAWGIHYYLRELQGDNSTFLEKMLQINSNDMPSDIYVKILISNYTNIKLHFPKYEVNRLNSMLENLKYIQDFQQLQTLYFIIFDLQKINALNSVNNTLKHNILGILNPLEQVYQNPVSLYYWFSVKKYLNSYSVNDVYKIKQIVSKYQNSHGIKVAGSSDPIIIYFVLSLGNEINMQPNKQAVLQQLNSLSYPGGGVFINNTNRSGVSFEMGTYYALLDRNLLDS